MKSTRRCGKKYPADPATEHSPLLLESDYLENRKSGLGERENFPLK
jgi:hypothetical protein